MLFTCIQCYVFCLDPLHLFNLYLSPGSSFLNFYVFTLTVLSFRVFAISFSSTSFDKGFLSELIHVNNINNTLLPRKVVVNKPFLWLHNISKQLFWPSFQLSWFKIWSYLNLILSFLHKNFYYILSNKYRFLSYMIQMISFNSYWPPGLI